MLTVWLTVLCYVGISLGQPVTGSQGSAQTGTFGVAASGTPLIAPTTGAVPSPDPTKKQTTDALQQTTQVAVNKTTSVAVATPKVDTVCYEYVGCFDNFGPFANAGSDLPISPEKLDSKYLLFTRKNPSNGTYHLLDYKKPSSFNVFDNSKKVKFIVHGFSNTAWSPWVMTLKDAFLKVGDFSVIVVDWGKGAKFPNYDQAVANTRLVATQLRLIIQELVKRGLKLEDVHMTGHSLGAHTSGYLGFLMKGRVGRISGMDPAEPDFEKLAEVLRLDPTDAQFVDVIHTNGAPILMGGAGLMQQSGHIDFYVNGGKTQPGCKNGISGALSSLIHGGSVVNSVSCSHSRSHELYEESLLAACPFTAYPCSSFEDFQKGKCLTCGSAGCSQLGYYSNQYSARGKMFLNTASQTPFCGYHYGIKVKINSTADTKGRLFVKMVGKWGTTEFLPITPDDTLKAGSDVQKVVVSPGEVGDLDSLVFKYVKHTGFWMGTGADSVNIGRVKVTSGENGSSYLFCYGGMKIPHNTEVKARISNRNSCS